jgi:hypothetical protein
MHQHIWCPTQQILVSSEQIIHVSKLGIIVPKIWIYLAQLYNTYNINKNIVEIERI